MIGFSTEPEFGENKTQEKTLEIMLIKPTARTKDIAEEIGITHRGVEKNIRTLKKSGIIDRIGPEKGGHWIVNRSD